MAEKGKCCGSGMKGQDKFKDMVDKIWPKTKQELEEVVHKVWPKTKKELEIGLKNTKELLAKGEKYLKDFSEKSIKNTKKLSLNLKKEKLYYDLGKTIANLSKEAWLEDKCADSLVKEIKNLGREIKKIK